MRWINQVAIILKYNKSNRNKNGSKKAKVTSTHYSANNTTLRPLSTHCLGFFSSQFIIVLMSTLWPDCKSFILAANVSVANLRAGHKTTRGERLGFLKPEIRTLSTWFLTTSQLDENRNKHHVSAAIKEVLSVLMLCTPVFIFTSGVSALLGRQRLLIATCHIQ